MLGRVRPSPMSSLESLEMERSSPKTKIIKHDTFSIYEATLLKLKQASQLHPSLPLEDSARMDVWGNTRTSSPKKEPMNSEADCSSPDSYQDSNFSYPLSRGSSEEKRGRSMSIVDLFSKYKSSRGAQSSVGNEVIIGRGSSSCPIVGQLMVDRELKNDFK